MGKKQQQRSKKSKVIAQTTFGSLAGTNWVGGVVKTKPFALCFSEMQGAHKRGEYDKFERRQFLLLGQLVASDRRHLRDFISNLLTFAYASKSIQGLESLLLTAAHMSWLAADVRMYRSALSLLSKALPSRAHGNHAQDRPSIYFVDRQFNLGTVMTSKMFDRIGQDLIRGMLGGGDIGSLLRGFGAGLASDGNSDIAGNLSGWAGVGAIIGAFSGAVVGGILGGALGGPAGAFGGAKLGGEVGGMLGGVIGFGVGVYELNKAEDDKNKDSSPPVSSDDTNDGGTVVAGGTDEDDDVESDEGTEASDEGEVETALVYPNPDDWLFMPNMIELVSTPVPDDDGAGTVLPGIGPVPNPALAPASATFALHGFNMLLESVRIERMRLRLA